MPVPLSRRMRDEAARLEKLQRLQRLEKVAEGQVRGNHMERFVADRLDEDRGRLMREGELRRRQAHRSETEDCWGSFDNVVRAMEEDR